MDTFDAATAQATLKISLLEHHYLFDKEPGAVLDSITGGVYLKTVVEIAALDQDTGKGKDPF